MNKVEASLDCGHSVRLSINSIEAHEEGSAYCRFDGHRIITNIYTNEWRVICADCQYGRWEGQSESQAKRTISNHRRYKQNHRVFHVYDRVTIRGGTSRKELIQEFLEEAGLYARLKKPSYDEPPF